MANALEDLFERVQREGPFLRLYFVERTPGRWYLYELKGAGPTGPTIRKLLHVLEGSEKDVHDWETAYRKAWSEKRRMDYFRQQYGGRDAFGIGDMPGPGRVGYNEG